MDRSILFNLEFGSEIGLAFVITFAANGLYMNIKYGPVIWLGHSSGALRPSP